MTVVYTLYKEYPSNAKYRASFDYYYENELSPLSDEHVTKAVVGRYDSLDAAQGQPDIKAELFSEVSSQTGGGYLANYSGRGQEFTVFTKEGEIHHVTVRAIDGNVPYGGVHNGTDLYWNINGAKNVIDNTANDNYLNLYTVSANDDSYYANGYRTLLARYSDTATSNSAVSLNKVKLSFNKGTMVGNVYAVNAQGASVPQESETTVQDFSQGSVQYSVTDTGGKDLRNYRVTVAGHKGDDAALFVNGPSGAAGEDKKPETNTREIFLNEVYDDRHDIFIANLGAAPLTNVRVTLTDAKD
jgi:hypothetical protein